MILIDTSAWIDFFRGRDPLARIVDDALAANDAAVCGPVETGLRRGLLNERERICPRGLMPAEGALGAPRAAAGAHLRSSQLGNARDCSSCARLR